MRHIIKQRKAAVTAAMKQAEAEVVFSHIEAMPQFVEARRVLLYHSLPDELPTTEVLSRWIETKDIYLPRVNGDLLDVVPACGTLDSNNRFHIAEPQGEAVNPGCIDLVIVPAVALDSHGHRLGRGKGFYDRLLSVARAYTIGVAMDCQLVDEVPCEPHDIPLNAVITASHQYYR